MSAPVDLLGTWDLRRRVRDRVTGMAGRVTGRLVLATDGAAITWTETGVLRWTGTSVPVSRDYRIENGAEGWWVYFADGRPFHRWQPGEPVEHRCFADLYRGVVCVESATRWRVLWDVHGPAKDQRLLTRLRRTDDPAR